MFKAALVLALETLAPLLIGWAMVRSRKPLWIRWAAGATAYVAYVGLAHSWLHTMRSWLFVMVSAEMFPPFIAILLGVSSSSATRLAKALTRIGIVAPWVEFALLPALVLAVAHYGRRLAGTGMALLRPRR